MKRKGAPPIVKVVASLGALVALGAGVLAGIDPLTCLGRGAIGYIAGHVFSGVWCALIARPSVETIAGPEEEPDRTTAAGDEGETTPEAAAA